MSPLVILDEPLMRGGSLVGVTNPPRRARDRGVGLFVALGARPRR